MRCVSSIYIRLKKNAVDSSFRSNNSSQKHQQQKNRKYKKEKKVDSYIIHRHIFTMQSSDVLCFLYYVCVCVCVLCEKTDRSTSRAYSVAA